MGVFIERPLGAARVEREGRLFLTTSKRRSSPHVSYTTAGRALPTFMRILASRDPALDAHQSDAEVTPERVR